MTNTLHILNKQQIPSALAATNEDSAVILTQDAVYLLLTTLPHELRVKLYAVDSDLKARGIEPGSNVEVIDYLQFVNLVIKYSNNVSW